MNLSELAWACETKSMWDDFVNSAPETWQWVRRLRWLKIELALQAYLVRE